MVNNLNKIAKYLKAKEYKIYVTRNFYKGSTWMVVSRGIKLEGIGIRAAIDGYSYFCTRKAIQKIKERYKDKVVDMREMASWVRSDIDPFEE